MVEPPVGMQAPTMAYTVFYLLFLASTIPIVAWMAWESWRRHSAVPLAALGGGLVVGVVVPPVFNHLTMVWFPSNIPFTFVTAFGMKDPWFDALGYAVFIGFGGYMLCRQLTDGHGARAVYAAFALWATADLVLELPFLAVGLYRYYGDQPFQIGGFPLHWVAMNGLVPVMSGALLYTVTERWPMRRGAGVRALGVPALAGALLLVPMFPVATALHAQVPSIVRWGASLVCVIICVVTVSRLARLAHREAPTAERPLGFFALLMGMTRGPKPISTQPHPTVASTAN